MKKKREKLISYGKNITKKKLWHNLNKLKPTLNAHKHIHEKKVEKKDMSLAIKNHVP